MIKSVLIILLTFVLLIPTTVFGQIIDESGNKVDPFNNPEIDPIDRNTISEKLFAFEITNPESEKGFGNKISSNDGYLAVTSLY